MSDLDYKNLILVDRKDVDEAVEKKLLDPAKGFDFDEATPDQVKEAAFRWLQDEIDGMLEDLDWYINRDQSGNFDEILTRLVNPA